MSTSLGRALRTALTFACALAALAFATTPAFALLSAEATEAAATLTVLGASYEAGTNTYTVPAGGLLAVTLNVGGSVFEPTLRENLTPGPVARAFCRVPTYAGAYVSVGALNGLPWRPSEEAGAETRTAGPTAWVNETATASVPGGPRGCATPFTLPDQVLLNTTAKTFLTTFTLNVCRETGGNYALEGSSPGPGGEPVEYLIPSSNATWHLYSIGALGTVAEQLEQVVNVRVTGLPSPSASC